MEEEIKAEFPDAHIEFELGSGGDFIVNVDGKVIFDKNEPKYERFPEVKEVVTLIKRAGF